MKIMEKLDSLKKTKRVNHEAIVQVKIPRELRNKLNKQLKEDNLTYKDLLLVAIEEYVEGRIASEMKKLKEMSNY